MECRLPKAFQFAGMHCGIKPINPDLALVVAEDGAQCFGVYTQNLVRAACIDWNRKITPQRMARAIIINSGNANACTGELGRANNEAVAEAVASELEKLGMPTTAEQVVVLSTGIIGHQLPMATLESGISKIVGKLTQNEAGFDQASRAILTTDRGPKTGFRKFVLDGVEYSMAAMVKGAGMIGPNMATMLGFVFTDYPLPFHLGNNVLKQAVDLSFNRLSVEGHTSTNDAVILMTKTEQKDSSISRADIQKFQEVLNELCLELAQKIPTDGEGASHLIHISVAGAANHADADRIARTIALSNLVKTAVAGADPNWGRIVSAAGYAGPHFDVAKTSLRINGLTVFSNGSPFEFDRKQVSNSIRDNLRTDLSLQVGDGPGSAEHWTSDLTIEYVKLNAEYST